MNTDWKKKSRNKTGVGKDFLRERIASRNYFYFPSEVFLIGV